MRIRRIDENGDMLFGGAGQLDLWHDVPEAVALYVMYRLRLNAGEWFADLTQGTPWATRVLGERTQGTRDVVVLDRIRNTPGVAAVAAFGSQMDVTTRTWNCAATIDTVYGEVQVILTRLPGEVPPISTPFLGITAGAGTRIQMTPADLNSGAHVNISDFQIVSMDPGRY